MASKDRVTFVCNHCGHVYGQWQGNCAKGCKSWDTIVEFKEEKLKSKEKARAGGYSTIEGDEVKRMSEVDSSEIVRISSGLGEFDRVAGRSDIKDDKGRVIRTDYGICVGSVILLSAEPGGGKTTLLSQVIGKLSFEMICMYSTGEESLDQYRGRMEDRLKVDYNDDNLFLMSEFSVENIIKKAIEKNVKFLVVDSIQSLEGDYTGSAGGVSQVKGCAQELCRYAKSRGVILCLLGHVNKNNSELAGPKVLAHIVDSVFHIDVSDSSLRVLRSSKNRFGDVDSVGIFQMNERGMISVDNPSKIFLSGAASDVSGSSITCIRDGNRNLLLETQALVTECDAEHPQRVCIGLNHNRLKMISAVLRKHGGIKLHHDIYINLVGGLKLPETDTSADLSLCAAIVSSLQDIPLSRQYCFIGETSLSGEVRPISQGVPRVSEAIKHGFTKIYIPKANYHKSMESKGVEILPIEHVRDLIVAIQKQP